MNNSGAAFRSRDLDGPAPQLNGARLPNPLLDGHPPP
jgi:hypothetical protein